MTKQILFGEFHLTVYAPPRLPESEYASIKRVRNSKRFQRELARCRTNAPNRASTFRVPLSTDIWVAISAPSTYLATPFTQEIKQVEHSLCVLLPLDTLTESRPRRCTAALVCLGTISTSIPKKLLTAVWNSHRLSSEVVLIQWTVTQK